MREPTVLLKDLIAIPSVNPMLPGAMPGDDESRLASHVAGLLEAEGIEVRLQPVKDGRCNVIGHLPRSGGADDHVILLTAHMDTYPAAGPLSAFTPVTEGSTVYGRGSADAKGPLAAMLTAFLDAAAVPDHRETYFAATVDEECLLSGVREMAGYALKRPSLAITGEPTRLMPIVAQKGIVRGSFLVRGPISHAAYPSGNSAICAVGDLIAATTALNAHLSATFTDTELGAPTLTLTRLDSSGGMNLVAREVRLAFDGRFLPGTTGEEYAQAVAKNLRGRVPDVDFELEALTFVSPPNRTPQDHTIATELFRAIEDINGTCAPDTFAYGSEAGVLAEFCDAALVFGPGDPRYSHAEVELIETDELESAVRILYRVLTGL